MAWSQDGKHLAFGRQESATFPSAIVVYDCGTGKQLGVIDGKQLAPANDPSDVDVRHFTWSPDGSHLLILAPDAHKMLLWHPTT